MGIGSWFKKRRKRLDDETIEAADEMDDETPEERQYMSGDIEAIEADRRAARMIGGGSMDDINRLGDH